MTLWCSHILRGSIYNSLNRIWYNCNVKSKTIKRLAIFIVKRCGQVTIGMVQLTNYFRELNSSKPFHVRCLLITNLDSDSDSNSDSQSKTKELGRLCLAAFQWKAHFIKLILVKWVPLDRLLKQKFDSIKYAYTSLSNDSNLEYITALVNTVLYCIMPLIVINECILFYFLLMLWK